MSIRKSIIMMANTGTQWNVVSDAVRGNAYYGYGNGMATVQVIYQNLVGGFGIQGTLSLTPAEEDWFWINLDLTPDLTTPYTPFPQNVLEPTGANGGDTGSLAATFIGNFVYLRAVLTRDYIQAVDTNTQWLSWQWGQIDSVLLSL